MPTPSPSAEIVSLEPNPTYPELEAYVESASPEDVEGLFASIRASLDALKGPRSEQAKKAKVALDHTVELLGRLLELRESLSEVRKKPVKKPR